MPAPSKLAAPRPLVGPVGSRARADCHARSLEIAHRAGDYTTFLRDLLEHVRSQPVPAGERAGERPLAKLDIEAHHEWTVGLFEAWAEVGEILTFYQERIANEGFLATAREARSVREIVRLVDHVPRPGVASTARLAYRLLELPGTPEAVIVPARASVVSVPERKEPPQTWETVEGLEARVEWNALRPRVASVEVRPALAPSAAWLDLEGIDLGLDAGSPLLLETAGDGGIEPLFGRVTEIEEIDAETAGGGALTRVHLDRSLSTEETEAPSRLQGVCTFDQELSLFGRDAPEWSELDDEVKARYAPPLGGVVVSVPEGGWRSINAGLPEEAVLSVVAGPDGSLYAGTANGIFRSVDSRSWSRSGADLVGQEILTLATDAQQQLFAGTAKNGVLRSSDGESWEVLLGESIREPLIALGRGRLPRSGRLPISPVRAILPAGGRLFAGTDHGVFVFEPQQDTWQAVSRGLPDWAAKTGRAGVVVQALVAGERPGELFAGTDKGLFHTADHGRSWEARNTGLPGHDPETGSAKVSVLALHLRRDRRTGASLLMAGSDVGIFRSPDGGASWETAGLGLPATDLETGLSETPVTALVAAADPTTLATRYFAATPEGLFVSADAGVYWSRAEDQVVGRPITALAPSPTGGLAAAVPLGGFARDRWPRFRVRDGRLDLVDAAPGIDEGDWLVLTDAGEDPGAAGEPLIEIVRVGSVRLLPREDFTLEGAVTRVVADRPLEHQDRFGLRTTRVLAGTRPLPLPTGRRRRLEPLAAEVVELDPERPLQPFPGRREVIVDGKPLRVRLAAAASLRTDEGRELEIGDGEEPQVLRASTAPGARVRLRLRLEGGEEGAVTVDAAGMAWRPARDEDSATAETVVAEWLAAGADGGGPALGLQPALRRCYDPATVRILANVVEATQGKTVYREVLGGGDATLAHQRFAIAAPPLTYLKTASAKGWSSTLEIRVDGVRWREIESLVEAGPADRVYMVRHDIDGVATVIFGDGLHGARLPTGRQNVVALYRTGFWPEAVSRGRLTVPETKPLGVDGVTNPLGAAGGARPESPDQTRARVPVSLRTLGRIVSRQDYEDFCRAYPGIAQARVASLATDGGEVVQVTVATDDGSPVCPGDELHGALLATVDAARHGRAPLSVDGCRRVPFDIAARIRFEAERRAGDVERSVRELLLATWSYERACFGGRVTASDVVRLIGGVVGVVSVKLERFHRAALEAGVEPYLEAAPAGWDADTRRILGAELLELRRPGGLRLVMVAAR